MTNPSIGQRLDLLAVSKPRMVKRHVWVFGILGLHSAVGAVASLVAGQWAIAVLTFFTATVCTFAWAASRRAVRRIHITTRWVDQLHE